MRDPPPSSIPNERGNPLHTVRKPTSTTATTTATISSDDPSVFPIEEMANFFLSSQHITTLLSTINRYRPTNTELVILIFVTAAAHAVLALAAISIVLVTPLIILSSPLWVPLLVACSTAALAFAFVFATATAAAWMYRNVTGVEHARRRIAVAAIQVRDYAREHHVGGGVYYWRRKRDAAPSA